MSDEAFDSHYAALTQDSNLAQAQKTENFRASGFFLPYYNKSTIAITGTTQADVNSVGYIKGGIMGGHFLHEVGLMACMPDMRLQTLLSSTIEYLLI